MPARLSAAARAGMMIGTMLLVNSLAWTQEPRATPQGKSELYYSLKDVINQGAELYNRFGDHAGCYRLWQGAILAVKPYLTPELQQRAEQGLAKAERLPTYAERAFELRAVLDAIRAQNVPAGVEKKTEEPPVAEKKAEPKEKAEEKKAEEKKPVEKKDEEKKAPADKEEKWAGRSQLSGRVTYAGKPLAAGYFVVLVGKDNKRFSTGVQKDGAYRFSTPLPTGSYRIAVETFLKEAPEGIPPIPQRYQDVKTSGLSVDLEPGPQPLNLDLTN